MAEEKMPEKKSKRDAMYDHSRSPKKGETKAPEKKPEAKAPEKTAEGGDGANPMMDMRGAMLKRHETERRDLHASHREDHRKMAARHDTEISEMMAAGTAPAAGETAPNDQAAPAAEAA